MNRNIATYQWARSSEQSSEQSRARARLSFSCIAHNYASVRLREVKAGGIYVANRARSQMRAMTLLPNSVF